MTTSRGRRRRDGGRSVLIAIVSTVVFFAVIALVVTSSPSWPLVQQDFFDGDVFWRYLPVIAGAFVLNIQLFLIVEVLVLVLGLLVAVLRSLSGPVFFPFRLLAIVYADVFRGLPSILIIFMLGFGIPGLGLPGVPSDPFFWAIVVADPGLLGLRLGGLPGRDRVDPSEPGGRGPLAGPDPGPGAAATWSSRRRSGG